MREHSIYGGLAVLGLVVGAWAGAHTAMGPEAWEREREEQAAARVYDFCTVLIPTVDSVRALEADTAYHGAGVAQVIDDLARRRGILR
jgi:hypothetical protein